MRKKEILSVLFVVLIAFVLCIFASNDVFAAYETMEIEPYVTAAAADKITQTSAYLYGYINKNEGINIASAGIDMRTPPSLTWTTVYTKYPINADDRTIPYTKTGLSHNTTYEYRTWARNVKNEFGNSVTIKFKTLDHSYKLGYESAHAHRYYYKCSDSSCGYYYYTGEYNENWGMSRDILMLPSFIR